MNSVYQSGHDKDINSLFTCFFLCSEWAEHFLSEVSFLTFVSNFL